ncbi:hypothetical protein LSH36_6g02030 [Paralvinella palmiformis]|uniref:Peroxisomal membrane protein PMP34 n=1 Tax=Paralvinella palmiformis TaxID=53620 RepID=A0AAD9NH48_9ANNE|nr:hypothetical protein LSH36_6g02030 [Paralvinella palmiformis]
MMLLVYIQALFSYRNLVHAIAGGLGNAFAISVCYPLECARTRLQVDDKLKAKYSLGVIFDVFQEEGIVGVYRGLSSLALSLFSSSFVYFFIFHGLKTSLTLFNKEQQVTMDLIFGSLAGAAVVLVTNPLWVINTRLKLEGAKLRTSKYKELKHPKYDGIIDCLKKIILHEGLLQLWSGTLTSLMLISNPAIQFMMYELLKRFTQTILDTAVLNGTYYFLFGAFSKTIATFVTYPLQVVQTRIRAGYTGKSVISVKDISLSWQGFSSLYRGLESKLSQTVLTAALTLLTYEKITLFVFSLMGLQQ